MRAWDEAVADAAAALQNGEAKPGIEFIWADDIALDIGKPGLVDGLLSTTAMTVAYGESGCGKTFVIIDLASRIALGMPWRDLDTQQGVVVYIAAEAPRSVEDRVWAWRKHHSVVHMPLVVVRSPVDLLRGGDVETVIGLIKQIIAERGHIALVVIDTLARAMVGNENAPEDMGAFVATCGQIRAAAETSILIVHHCGKDVARGARGWSGLRAATDVELEITEGCIKVSKNRDQQEGQVYGFRLEQIELGHNAKGRRVTTCVAIEADPPAGHASKKRKLGSNEQIVFDALLKAVADQADPPPPAPGIPAHARGASVTRWRDTACLRLPHGEQKRKNQAFDRAVISLVASCLVGHLDGYAWVP
jgi:putative DNA primase/helicase